MEREDKTVKFLEKAFSKMFAMVGREYKKEICMLPDWYMGETWPIEKQKEFSTWMEREYKKTFRSSTREAKWETSMFVLCYGWKTVTPPHE